jgi:hypothetical protein
MTCASATDTVSTFTWTDSWPPQRAVGPAQFAYLGPRRLRLSRNKTRRFIGTHDARSRAVDPVHCSAARPRYTTSYST